MTMKFIVALVSFALPCLALAQGDGKYQCTYGDLTRRVEILTEPGVSVPCEVHYYKDTEAPGEKQVLWSAGSQAGYCEEKAEAFIAKLVSWGWDCGEGAATEMDADEAPAEEPVQDDTDVLSPGNPDS